MLSWMIMPYRRFADFSGRSRRREFWSFALFNVLVNAALQLLFGQHLLLYHSGLAFISTGLTGGAGVVGSVFALVSVIPNLAVSVRRLHDQDRSGWLLLLFLIPVLGWFALFVMVCLNGTHGPNRFGPDPKQPDIAAVFS